MEPVLVSSPYMQNVFLYPLMFLIVVLTATYYYETRRIVKYGSKLPGPKRLPFIGNALMTLGVKPEQVLEMLMKYDVYGPITRAFLGTKLFIFMQDPRDIEIILGSSIHIDKSEDYRYFKPWLGEGLLISTGEKWRTHRKIIAPTFHMNILKTFVPLFNQNSLDLVERLRSSVGQEIDIHDHMLEITVDILLDTAMGLRGLSKHKNSTEYAQAVMKLCDIIHQRQYQMMLRFDALFKYSKMATEQERLLSIIHGLTGSVIQKRKEEYQRLLDSGKMEDENSVEESMKTVESNEYKQNSARLHYVRDDLDDIDENDIGLKKRKAFLDFMLEMHRNGDGLSEEEIQEEVDTIMFEGHDTTAAGSSFVLSLLGIHQDVQDRVYEELNEIFKGSDRQCTFQDTLEMKYLERVILESLRLFPPVPAIARNLNHDVKLASQDAILPKGSTVIISVFKTHRLEEFYENPEEFNPDNFLPERMQKRHFYSYIPFSAGPRSCVGRKYAMLKLKVLLSTILRNYKILSDIKEKDFRLKVDIILKRADGFRIKLEPRNKAC